MTFSIGDLKFIDSFQIMVSSLEQIVENLYNPSDKFNNFTFMQQNYPQHIELLCQKGYYPYDSVNDIKKLDQKGLPPKDAFYSLLTQDSILYDEKHDPRHTKGSCDLQQLPFTPNINMSN